MAPTSWLKIIHHTVFAFILSSPLVAARNLNESARHYVPSYKHHGPTSLENQDSTLLPLIAREAYPMGNDNVFRRLTPRPWPRIRVQNLRLSSSKRILRLAVFGDYALLDHFAELEPLNPWAAVHSYLTTEVSAMEGLLNEAAGEDQRIEIVLVHIGVWSERSAEPLQEGQVGTTLLSFCKWASSVNAVRGSPGHWHHAILMSGNEIFSDTTASLGSTFKGGACHPERSCSLVEAKSFRAVYIAAHEVAHSLGVPHDGEDEAALCPSVGFIMGEALNDDSYSWSNCTKEAFGQILAENECLDADVSFADAGSGDDPYVQGVVQDVFTHKFPELDHSAGYRLPGERYPADAQCRVAHGGDYKAIPSSRSLCEYLTCSNGALIQGAHPALLGTSCGEKLVCQEGSCAQRAGIPTPEPPSNNNQPPPGTSTPPGSFPSPPGNFPSPPGSFPSPPGSFPSPPGSFPSPPGNFPTPPGNFPSPPGNFPAPPGNFPAPPGNFPAPPGSFPAPPGNFPAPPGSFPAPPGNFPFPPGNQFPNIPNGIPGNMFPGFNIPNNIPGINIPGNIPGSNIPGFNIPSNIPGNTPGSNIPNNIPGLNIPSNIPGLNIPSNIPGLNIPSNIPGLNIPGLDLGNGIPSFFIPANTFSPVVNPSPTVLPAVQNPTQQTSCDNNNENSSTPSAYKAKPLPKDLRCFLLPVFLYPYFGCSFSMYDPDQFTHIQTEEMPTSMHQPSDTMNNMTLIPEDLDIQNNMTMYADAMTDISDSIVSRINDGNHKVQHLSPDHTEMGYPSSMLTNKQSYKEKEDSQSHSAENYVSHVNKYPTRSSNTKEKSKESHANVPALINDDKVDPEKPKENLVPNLTNSNSLLTVGDFSLSGSDLQLHVSRDLFLRLLDPLTNGAATTNSLSNKDMEKSGNPHQDVSSNLKLMHLKEGFHHEPVLSVGAPTYIYVTRFSPCSKSCGTGMRTTKQVCVQSTDQSKEVASEKCIGQPINDQPSAEACNTFPCQKPQWLVGSWGPCSQWCDTGIQYRLLSCAVPLLPSGSPSAAALYLHPKHCLNDEKPTRVRLCKGPCLEVNCDIVGNKYHPGCTHLLGDTDVETDYSNNKPPVIRENIAILRNHPNYKA